MKMIIHVLVYVNFYNLQIKNKTFVIPYLETAFYPSAKNISLVKKYVNLSFANNFIQKAVGVQYHLMYMCIVRVMIKNNYIWVT